MIYTNCLKKTQAVRTEAEKKMLNMYALKQQSSETVRALSPSYRRGSMLADMLPYVGEFILTSGAFSVVRAGTKKALTKGINKYVITKAQYASVKSGGKGCY